MPRVILALVSCLFTLALAELGMRVASPGTFRVWEPGLSATFTPRPGVLPGIHGVSRFAINTIGMRGDEPSRGPAYRILTLGGSTTECLFLDQSEAWPHLLQEQLTSPSKRVVVENAGKSGHSTRHHLVQLTHLLPQHPDFDAVVILAGVNDVQLWLEKPAAPFEPTGPADYRKAFMVLPDRAALPPDAPFYERLHLYRLFHEERGVDPKDRTLVQDFEGVFYTSLRERRRLAPKRATLPDLPGALTAYRGHLEALADLAAQHKVTLVLMTQPVLWKNDLPPELDRLLWFGWADRPGEHYATSALAEAMEAHNQVMRDVCQKRGLSCVDLAALVPRDSSALYDDCHFNEGGARLVAEAVAERFLTQGPLGDPARAEALRVKREARPSAEALVAEAKRLLDAEHEPIQAASALRRALALEPGHAEAARLLAVALAQAGVAAAPLPDPDGETMKAGLAALYTSRDYPAAIAAFQQVLGRTPSHYGATYQLAVALDRAGKGDEARAQWARVLALGEQYADAKVIAEARARLGKQDGK